MKRVSWQKMKKSMREAGFILSRFTQFYASKILGKAIKFIYVMLHVYTEKKNIFAAQRTFSKRS